MNMKHIPDSKLEWYLLNALPEREQAQIAALEQSDEELRGRIEALRASDAEILEEYPPARMAERLAQKYPGARGAAWPIKRGGARRKTFLILICAALLLMLPMLFILVSALFDAMEVDDVKEAAYEISDSLLIIKGTEHIDGGVYEYTDISGITVGGDSGAIADSAGVRCDKDKGKSKD